MTDTTAEMATADAAIRDYVRDLLRTSLVDEEARQEKIRALEKSGHRIVDGGQTGTDNGLPTWEITDWRTGDLIKGGTGSYEAYDAAATQLDPDDKWLHIDKVDDELTEVEPVGIPASLADALQDWIGSAGTSDEDVAEFVGWSVEEVAWHRDEA
ncbi:hypothetical protein OG693_39440 (plasmid) [Streptomyces sp. NBC_01259]|uniref:hypothetical protein n=1 Tax=Streptomyces sp. NBC_01259 TaxID=2903800 RepID=UPI002F90C451